MIPASLRNYHYILNRCIERFGRIRGARIFFKLFVYRTTKINVVSIKLPSYTSLLFLRPRSSDVDVFRQVLLDAAYNLSFLHLNPHFIVDAGANIGLCSAYFAHVYPQAQIYAIEPDQSNYQLLLRNSQPYSNIKPHQAALWNKSTYLEISNPEAAKWAFQVKEQKDGSIKGITVDQVLEDAGFEQIDIMKIDIEGAEKELFSSGYEKWLEKVKVIVIELHDRLIAGCSEKLENAVSKYSFFRTTNRNGDIILYKVLI